MEQMEELEKIGLAERKNSGFIYQSEEEKDYILGVNSPLLKPPIIFADSHGWHNETIRAKSEMQFNFQFDSFSCVIFSIAKCLVAYMAKVYGYHITVSEMFNAFYAGVKQGRGTTVRNGLESFRKYGWVEDKDYSFTAETTAAQFFSQPPLKIQIKAKGKLTEWLVKFEQLDYSGNVPHNKIIDALKRTPVVCSGFAWSSYYGEGIYHDYNQPANHCFPIDEWSTHPDYDLIAYDSYPQDSQFDQNSEDVEFEKKLARNFKIWSAHRIWCEPLKKNCDLIRKLKYMFEKIKMIKPSGAKWFIKNGEAQEITSWQAFMAAIIDEVGCGVINVDDLKKFKMTNKFFGK